MQAVKAGVGAAKCSATCGEGEGLLSCRELQEGLHSRTEAGVTITVQPGSVEFKGPKGTLTQRTPPHITFEVAGTDLVAKTVRARSGAQQISTGWRGASWPTPCAG